MVDCCAALSRRFHSVKCDLFQFTLIWNIFEDRRKKEKEFRIFFLKVFINFF